MHEAERLVWFAVAKEETEVESILPLLFSQKNVHPHAQNFEMVLLFGIELIQLGKGIVEHSELRITFCHPDYLFEGHCP